MLYNLIYNYTHCICIIVYIYIYIFIYIYIRMYSRCTSHQINHRSTIRSSTRSPTIFFDHRASTRSPCRSRPRDRTRADDEERSWASGTGYPYHTEYITWNSQHGNGNQWWIPVGIYDLYFFVVSFLLQDATSSLEGSKWDYLIPFRPFLILKLDQWIPFETLI